jgi:predicted cobalt transporter CbtA
MAYICPMHPEVRSETPGTCPKCGGMKLVPEEKAHLGHAGADESFFSTYKPLFVIVGLILLASVVSTLAGGGDWREGMLSFMAGFFLVFAGLKLLDVPGFAKGYATYDLLAARVPAYGYAYPFLELALGLLYLARYELDAVNIAAVALMLFSGLGVAINLAKGKKFQCACLGTMIKVPLTKVTLIEDFGMAAMAIAMLLA